MKLAIEIENITNPDACAGALEQLYDAIQEHHGHTVAKQLFLPGIIGYPSKYPGEERRNRILDNIRRAPEDFRLALEFYAMPKPNKEGLAEALAEKNEILPKEERYGPRGTTSPMTMLKQIKRVLKREECREVAKLTPAQQVEALRFAEALSSINAYMRSVGQSVSRRRLMPALKTSDVGIVKVTRG